MQLFYSHLWFSLGETINSPKKGFVWIPLTFAFDFKARCTFNRYLVNPKIYSHTQSMTSVPVSLPILTQWSVQVTEYVNLIWIHCKLLAPADSTLLYSFVRGEESRKSSVCSEILTKTSKINIDDFESLWKHISQLVEGKGAIHIWRWIFVFVRFSITLPAPCWGSCLWRLKVLSVMIHCSVLCFLALSSASAVSAAFLMAAQLVFLVHLSLRVF